MRDVAIIDGHPMVHTNVLRTFPKIPMTKEPMIAEFPVLQIVDRTGATSYVPLVCDEAMAVQIGQVLYGSGKYRDVALITRVEMDLVRVREKLRR